MWAQWQKRTQRCLASTWQSPEARLVWPWTASLPAHATDQTWPPCGHLAEIDLQGRVRSVRPFTSGS